MNPERRPAEAWGRNLAQALRQIRKVRGLTIAQAAHLMHMDRRNYANFEAGKGRLNVHRLLHFAEVTDSDPWALLAGILMGAPQLASGAVNNKLLLAFFILLGEFEARVGEGLEMLETTDVISAFGQAFNALEAALQERQARSATRWLEEGAARIGLKPEATDDETA